MAEQPTLLEHFLYILLRDEVPVGAIEKIMKEHVEFHKHTVPRMGEKVSRENFHISFSCEHTAAKARELAQRLTTQV